MAESTTKKHAAAESVPSVTTVDEVLDAPEPEAQNNVVLYQRPTLSGARNLALIDTPEGRVIAVFEGQNAQIVAPAELVEAFAADLSLFVDMASQLPVTSFDVAEADTDADS